jgi:hypothetical protein
VALTNELTKTIPVCSFFFHQSFNFLPSEKEKEEKNLTCQFYILLFVYFGLQKKKNNQPRALLQSNFLGFTQR